MSNNFRKLPYLIGAFILSASSFQIQGADLRGEKTQQKPASPTIPSTTSPQDTNTNKPVTPVAPAPGPNNKPAPTPGDTNKPVTPVAPAPGPDNKPAPTPGDTSKPVTPVAPAPGPDNKPAPTPGDTSKPVTPVAPAPGPDNKPAPPTPGDTNKPVKPIAPPPGPDNKPAPPTPGDTSKPVKPIAPPPGPDNKPAPCPESNCKPVKPGCEQAEYFKTYLTIIENMQKDMNAFKATGNAAIDFLGQMIPHHQAAIEMSENLLNYSTNPEVKALATSIIKEQKPEIERMEKLLMRLKAHNTNSCDSDIPYMKNYLATQENMMKELENLKTTCNIDAAYLSAMISHHQAAIEMANNVLEYTNNGAVKRMAKNIIKTQQPQIKEMEALLESLNQ